MFRPLRFVPQPQFMSSVVCSIISSCPVESNNWTSFGCASNLCRSADLITFNFTSSQSGRRVEEPTLLCNHIGTSQLFWPLYTRREVPSGAVPC